MEQMSIRKSSSSNYDVFSSSKGGQNTVNSNTNNYNTLGLNFKNEMNIPKIFGR